MNDPTQRHHCKVTITVEDLVTGSIVQTTLDKATFDAEWREDEPEDFRPAASRPILAPPPPTLVIKSKPVPAEDGTYSRTEILQEGR